MPHPFVIIAGRPRSGTTWLARCVEMLVGRHILFEPFESGGMWPDSLWPDDLQHPELPVELRQMAQEVKQRMYPYIGDLPPDLVQNVYEGMVGWYMQFRPQVTGVKVTRHTPSTVSFFADRNPVVLRIRRSLIDTCTSIMQRWPDTWCQPEMELAADRYGNQLWSMLVDKYEGEERRFASTYTFLSLVTIGETNWLRDHMGNRWLDLSYESLMTSPLYWTAPIADLLDVEMEQALWMLEGHTGRIHTRPELVAADVILRRQQIAQDIERDWPSEENGWS